MVDPPDGSVSDRRNERALQRDRNPSETIVRGEDFQSPVRMMIGAVIGSRVDAESSGGGSLAGPSASRTS